jgi:hypothetical protein
VTVFMVYDTHVPNVHNLHRPIRSMMWNVVISERILSFCVGRIVHAWQQRRTIPFVIANSLLLDARNDVPFMHTHKHPGTKHKTTHTHNWIRAHTYTVLTHLHAWFLAFHYDTPSSTRLLRVWLNAYAKSWRTNDTMIVFHIPNAVNTNRYQVNIYHVHKH